MEQVLRSGKSDFSLPSFEAEVSVFVFGLPVPVPILSFSVSRRTSFKGWSTFSLTLQKFGIILQGNPQKWYSTDFIYYILMAMHFALYNLYLDIFKKEK